MSNLSELLPSGGGQNLVEFVASGTLPNGKPVVLKSNGQIEVVAQTGAAQSIPAGSSATYNSSGTDPLVSSRSCCFIPQVANKFVIIYKDATAGHGVAVVGTVSNASISFGTPVVFNSGLTNFMSIDFTASVSGRCVIAYQNNANSSKGTVVIGTVAGTGISFSSPIIFNNAVTRVFGVAFGSGSIDDRLVISYMDQGNSNYGTAICGDVNAGGTAIAFGSEVVFNSGTSNFADVAFDPTSNTKFVICYKNQSNSHYATAIVGSASSTSLSFGSNVVFLSSYTTDVSVRYNPNVGNQFVVLCSDQYASPTKGVAYVGTVSNTTPSFGPQVVFNPLATTLQSIAFDPNTAGRLLVSYSDDGNSSKSTVNIGTMSGSTLSFGNKIIAINLTSSPQTVAFDSNTTGKFVFPFIDYTNSSSGKALVCQLVTSVTNLTATNLIGISAEAASSGATAKINTWGGINESQTSLTIGSDYYAQTDGTITTASASPAIKLGTAISSTTINIRDLP